MADTMMSQTLTYCSDSCLADCLELRTWQRLEVCLQEERAGLEGREGGVYTDWRFSHLYTDQGLPLHTDDLLPLTAACLTSVLPLVEETPLPFLPRSRPANIEMKDMAVIHFSPDTELFLSSIQMPELLLAMVSLMSNVTNEREFYKREMINYLFTDFVVRELS